MISGVLGNLRTIIYQNRKNYNILCYRRNCNIILDCSQSPIFPFDRRDRAQTVTIFVLKQRARTGGERHNY